MFWGDTTEPTALTRQSLGGYCESCAVPSGRWGRGTITAPAMMQEQLWEGCGRWGGDV